MRNAHDGKKCQKSVTLGGWWLLMAGFAVRSASITDHVLVPMALLRHNRQQICTCSVGCVRAATNFLSKCKLQTTGCPRISGCDISLQWHTQITTPKARCNTALHLVLVCGGWPSPPRPLGALKVQIL